MYERRPVGCRHVLCLAPVQEPVYVMLKEYLPGAKTVACNELQVLHI